MAVNVFTPVGRCGPGMRINVQSTTATFDELTVDLFDPVSAQIMCTAQITTTTPINPSPVLTPFFGVGISDTATFGLGDPIVGLADGAPIQAIVNFRLAGVVQDTRTVTGYSWDAVSGAWNLWSVLLGQAPGGATLDAVLAAVQHTLPS